MKPGFILVTEGRDPVQQGLPEAVHVREAAGLCRRLHSIFAGDCEMFRSNRALDDMTSSCHGGILVALDAGCLPDFVNCHPEVAASLVA